MRAVAGYNLSTCALTKHFTSQLERSPLTFSQHMIHLARSFTSDIFFFCWGGFWISHDWIIQIKVTFCSLHWCADFLFICQTYANTHVSLASDQDRLCPNLVNFHKSIFPPSQMIVTSEEPYKMYFCFYHYAAALFCKVIDVMYVKARPMLSREKRFV